MKIRGLVCAFVMMAGAASVQAATATANMSIPFAFYVRGKLMPAGQYRVQEDPEHRRAVLLNTTTKECVNVLLSPGEHQPGEARLKFQSGKNGYSLKSVS